MSTAYGTQTTSGPGGTATNPSRVHFSNPGQPDVGDRRRKLGRGRNFIDLTPGDGEQIQAAVTWRELVFIFKETKFFVMWGESTAADGTPVFNVREVVNSRWPWRTAKRSAVGRDGVYFLNRRGVYHTNGGDPVLLSDRISTVVDRGPGGLLPGHPDQPAAARGSPDGVGQRATVRRCPDRRRAPSTTGCWSTTRSISGGRSTTSR
jgi:hypothetical protein